MRKAAVVLAAELFEGCARSGGGAGSELVFGSRMPFVAPPLMPLQSSGAVHWRRLLRALHLDSLYCAAPR